MNMSISTWNETLIKKYSTAAPRYTSYPTALQFDAQFDTQQLSNAITSSASKQTPLSLYIHIPFCRNICYYCGCNKIVTKHRSNATNYLRYLYKEIALQAAQFDSDKQTVEQLHIGGGTPTFLSNDQLFELISTIRQHFQLLNGDRGDYSIELDPREADWETLHHLRGLGFNRISLGVQDFDAQVQQAIHREQSVEQVQSLVDSARTMLYRSIHFDLIYGLPKQSVHSFMQTIDQVIDMYPDRISLFNYAHMPERFATQRRIKESDLPSAETKLAIFQHASQRLLTAGYRYIGMDHFALPDDTLAIAQEDGTLHRNFQGYTTHPQCDLIGLGISAISHIGDTYSQNSTNPQPYYQLLDDDKLPIMRGLKLNHDDIIRQTVIAELICHFKLNVHQLEQQYQIDFMHYFKDALSQLQPMIDDGLLNYEQGILTVSEQGRHIIRNICVCFDRYLNPLPIAQRATFSRVI